MYFLSICSPTHGYSSDDEINVVDSPPPATHTSTAGHPYNNHHSQHTPDEDGPLDMTTTKRRPPSPSPRPRPPTYLPPPTHPRARPSVITCAPQYLVGPPHHSHHPRHTPTHSHPPPTSHAHQHNAHTHVPPSSHHHHPSTHPPHIPLSSHSSHPHLSPTLPPHAHPPPLSPPHPPPSYSDIRVSRPPPYNIAIRGTCREPPHAHSPPTVAHIRVPDELRPHAARTPPSRPSEDPSNARRQVVHGEFYFKIFVFIINIKKSYNLLRSHLKDS